MGKTIGIIGASAGVGALCVRLALNRGHRIRTLSRRVEGLPRHAGLEAIQGSATDVQALRRALQGAEAIVVTLGTGMDRKPTTLYSDFGRALLQLQPELGSTPIQILTGFGAGDSAAYQGPVARLLFRLLLRAVYENKTALEEMVQASSLNWSLVRPGLLTNAATAEPAHVQTDYHPGMKVGAVSRRAVARFLIEQAEHPTCQYLKPALSARA
ncbi:MAG: NAD(P)H-binding protein [Burkholderiaceae bacterium]